MREQSQITTGNDIGALISAAPANVDSLFDRLDRDGIVVLPNLLTPSVVHDMQQAFGARLKRMRWNNFDGYQRTEKFRHMVEDVLVLDQGFVDLVLHPVVKEILNRYLGDEYELTEAKGWKSLPTKRDFHGWHGDAWYDDTVASEIHREVKLAIYLTDVKSGAFNYILGSHRQQHPRVVSNSEVENISSSRIAEIKGEVGTAFLFDTSGIHRQGVPMLEERRACFFNYHNPAVPLQREDVDYYRYHPLILNAAFLGDLSAEDHRILGFGNKQNYQRAFERAGRPSVFGRLLQSAHNTEVAVKHFQEMVTAKLKRTFSR